jgi:iron complex outermembrane receptor protein
MSASCVCARTAIAGVLALAAPNVGLAQDNHVIDVVTVWAEKRAAPLQKVPIAISTLAADELHSGGIDSADDLAARLPFLDLQRSAGVSTTSLRVRRVGSIGNIPTFEPAVGVFIDGAFRSRSFLGTTALLNVDHIEVLRGPQSTLYGKNVSGGVLAVYTRQPGERFDFNAELTGGRIDAVESATVANIKLGLAGPITTTLGGSLAAQWSQHDHTLTNVLPGPPGDDEHRLALHGQLAWSPNDALDVRLTAGYFRENDDQGESDVFLAPGAGSTLVSSLLQQLSLAPNCNDNVPRNRRLCSVATNEFDLEAVDVTLLGEYELANGWSLQSVTGWDRYKDLRIEDDAIQLFAPIMFYHDAEEGRSVQEELRLASADAQNLTWLVGVFYYRNTYERGDDGREPMFGANGALALHPIWPAILGGLPLAMPGQLGIHDSRIDTRYLSAFGQLSWRITQRFSLTAGLRWQEEEKEAAINNSVTVPGASLISAILTPSTTLSGQVVNGALSRKSDDLPWSITPQYRFSDDLITYFTLARGSKSGGFNTGFGDAPLALREFGDESIRHFELGAKSTLADRRVQINAAAFYTQYDNYQDAAFVSAQFSVDNAERVKLKGMEVEGSMRLGERLKVDAAISFADLRYDKNTHGMCYPGRAPDGSSPTSCVLSGEHPINAPEWETHLGLQYEAPATWGGLFARLDWSWTDAYNTSFSADPRLVQPASDSVGLRAGTRIGESCELVFWGANLLDEKVSYMDAVLNLFNDASYQSYLAQPRTWGVTIRIRL